MGPLPLQMTRRPVVLLLAAFLLNPVGCGGPEGKLVPVKGTVTVGGKTLTQGSVSFRPDQTAGPAEPVEPSGNIEADGTYKVYTNGKEGAPVGKYTVLLVSTEEVDPNNPSATPKSLIPAKYSSSDSLFLIIEVKEDAPPGQYDIKLP